MTRPSRHHPGLLLAVVLLASTSRLGLSASIRANPQSTHECFLFARLGETKPDVSDAAECGLATAPASTFKIPHALIALQTGVITTDTVIKWDGTGYEFESWRRDHTLSSAIKASVRPFFEQTARLIGPQRMHDGLSSLGYAADAFDGNASAFWVTGDLVVSPMEQFGFLQRFFAGTLPIEGRHLSAVKEAMRMPPGQILLGAGPRSFELRWPKDTIVRAKTGNTTVKGERVSWLMGALESRGVEYVFVARARSKSGLENNAGAEVARRGLNARVPTEDR
jgi:beta-lactamase class D